jgi:DNA-binding NarL/FixJ family response regulator
MKILVVDDHPLIISGCVNLFAKFDGITLYDAKTGNSGFKMYISKRPSISIIDITLPDMSGFELISKIKKHEVTARTIVLSTTNDSAFATKAKDIGADGFVSKDDEPQKLIDAIQNILSGSSSFFTSYNKIIHNRKVNKNTFKWQILNTRERAILKLIGSGMRPRDISLNLGLSPKTISNNCTNMKRKLGLSSSHELSQRAYEYKSIL